VRRAGERLRALRRGFSAMTTNPYESHDIPIQAELSGPSKRWDLYDWSAFLIYIATATGVVALIATHW
jgi:hypothetical protein